MHFAFIINNLCGGGAERVVQTLATHWCENHHTVSIILLDHSTQVYQFSSEVKMYRLASGLVCKGQARILLMPLQALELSRLLRRISPDGVMSVLVRANLVHLMTKMWGNKKRVVISERTITNKNYQQDTFSGRSMLRLIQHYYPRADRILAISGGVRDALANLGVSEKLITVVHNPQDIDQIRAKAVLPVEHWSAPPVPTLVTCSRLAPEKDIPTLLRALAVVNTKTPAHLVVLGSGPEEAALKRCAADLGIAGRVSWLGWRENPFQIIRNCQVFLLGSLFEGFGNVVVEALACGVPVISTDCPGGPREILYPEHGGRLVPMGDSEAMAKEILNLLSDAGLRNRLAEAAVVRADDFRIEKIAPQYSSLMAAGM